MTHKYFSLLTCPRAQKVPYHKSTSSPAYKGALEGLKKHFQCTSDNISYMSTHY